MIRSMICLATTVTEQFIRVRKLNISTGFITQCYFTVPKDVRLNCTNLLYYENFKLNRASANHI